MHVKRPDYHFLVVRRAQNLYGSSYFIFSSYSTFDVNYPSFYFFVIYKIQHVLLQAMPDTQALVLYVLVEIILYFEIRFKK